MDSYDDMTGRPPLTVDGDLQPLEHGVPSTNGRGGEGASPMIEIDSKLAPKDPIRSVELLVLSLILVAGILQAVFAVW